jgi:hypothetical protein
MPRLDSLHSLTLTNPFLDFQAPKERHHIKKLLAREEGVFPSLYPSLRKALIPLLDPAAMDLLAAVQRTVEEASEGTRRAMRQRGARLVNGKNAKKYGGGKPDSALVASDNIGRDVDDGSDNLNQRGAGTAETGGARRGPVQLQHKSFHLRGLHRGQQRCNRWSGGRH